MPGWDIIGQQVINVVLAALMGGLLTYLTTAVKSIKALKGGLTALLRDRILQSYQYSNARGYMPVDERESFVLMCDNYHGLGGNGMIDDIRVKALALPTCPQIEDHDD